MAGFVLPFLRKKYLMQLYRQVSGYGLGQRFFYLLSAYPSVLQNVNPKEGAEKLKRNRKRFLAGALAFLLTCSTLLELGAAARAADPETKTENLPELAEIRGQLNEDEIILAEDLILTVGDKFDGENKDSGLLPGTIPCGAAERKPFLPDYKKSNRERKRTGVSEPGKSGKRRQRRERFHGGCRTRSRAAIGDSGRNPGYAGRRGGDDKHI